MAVDPTRIHQARVDAGLSLGQVAGDDVSRTLIHFIEHGRTRPSQRVLALIARRTGKPINYFLDPTGAVSSSEPELSQELRRVASRVRQLSRAAQLTRAEHEALRLVELTLQQGAHLVSAVQVRGSGRSRPGPSS